jgi:hypothetical protein
MQSKLQVSLKNRQNDGKLQICIAVFFSNGCEWSASGSDRFISEHPCTEVLGSVDVTAVVIVNY